MNLGTFFVNQVIVHPIPKVNLKAKAGTSLELSDVPSALDTRLKNYFRERINASLSAMQFSAIYDPTTASPVPKLVLDFFDPLSDDFVAMSQEMANYLFSIQPGGSSEGMLAVIDGTIGTGKNIGNCLAVLKLEMDSAIRLQPTRIDGKLTYDLQLQEVTMNDRAKVFKAALFRQPADLASVSAVASDNQRGDVAHQSEVATFFLQFLGCRLADSPDRATKEYLDRTTAFINDMIDDPEKKLRYELAILSDLASNSKTINPKTVAKTHFDTEDQDTFLNLFKDEGGNISTVKKDDELIKPRLKTAYIQFANGLRLSGSPEAIDAAVQVSDGRTVIDADVSKIGR